MPNLEQLRIEVVNRLPQRSRWLIQEGLPLDWDFSRARDVLLPVSPDEVSAFEIPASWQSLRLFGESSWQEGGGSSPYIGIDAATGTIFELNFETEDDEAALHLMSSTMAQFIETFQLLDRTLVSGLAPGAVDGILAKLREIDPKAAEVSGWWGLVSYLGDL